MSADAVDMSWGCGWAFSTAEITLNRVEQVVPQQLALGQDEVIPIRAGESVAWTIARQTQ